MPQAPHRLRSLAHPRRILLGLVIVVVLALDFPDLEAAEAAPRPQPAKPTALVTLGDSYISGEAGRWNGNSAVPVGSRMGTDRAWTSGGVGGYDPSRVYGPTAGGCHRSDVAPALSNTVPVAAKINFACSGARTSNIFRTSSARTGQRGELPQADQLASVARTHDVELVVLSIGGNDLGFGAIVQACVTAYATVLTRCEPEQQAAVDAAMPAAMDGVAKAVDEIRASLSATGQRPGSYRLVLQSYPSPVPRGDDNRYAELAGGRLGVGGCPFFDSDSDWARDRLVPQISSNLRAVAVSKGVDFLDLSDAFSGREACARTATQSTGTPNGATAEWARFLDTNVQGLTQESLHPNAYGQQAIGRCYSQLARVKGSARCVNTAGVGPAGMLLAPLT